MRTRQAMEVARQVFVLLSVLVVGWGLERCEAAGKFSFDVHHMFSDAVKKTLGFDNLVPEKGSLEYFKVLAHRDRFIRGRGLAFDNEETPLTSMKGNLTLALNFLGFLHYANVSVGTPATWFLVALDTGSDLFGVLGSWWLWTQTALMHLLQVQAFAAVISMR